MSDGPYEVEKSLRERATDQFYREEGKEGERELPTCETDLNRIIHELRVHQIELEMQNEELKRARGEIEIGLQQYTSLYDHAPAGYLTLDRSGIIQKINLTGADILGVLRSELSHSSFFIFISEHSRKNFDSFLSRVYEGGQPLTCDIELMRPDRQRICIQVRACSSSSPQECHLVFTDVTERVTADRAYHKATHLLGKILEVTPNLIYIYDLQNHRNTYSNREVYQFLGYSEQEFKVMGTDLFSHILHPEDLERVALHHARFTTAGDGDVYELIYRMRDASGTWRWLKSRDTLFSRTPEGDAEQILGSTEDITERKILEEELVASEFQYRTLVEYSSDVIFCVDRNGYYTFVNQVLASTFGKTIDYFYEKSLWDIYPKELADQCYDAIVIVFLTGKARSLEVMIPLPDQTRYYHSTLNPIQDSEGNVVQVLTHSVDITDRKHSEDALRQLNRQLNLMNSITRHDILNKVAVFRALLYLITNEIDISPVFDKFTNLEQTAADIQSQIEFTRVYEKVGSQDPGWQHVRASLMNDRTPDSISFILNIQEIDIFADPLFERVFYNLLDNSIRHGQTVRTIRISSRESSQALTLIWEDDGVGVPIREKEMIFDQGYGKNTGLGLFLIKEILSFTGIEITETGEEGKGARFEITVPKGGYRLCGGEI